MDYNKLSKFIVSFYERLFETQLGTLIKKLTLLEPTVLNNNFQNSNNNWKNLTSFSLVGRTVQFDSSRLNLTINCLKLVYEAKESNKNIRDVL